MRASMRSHRASATRTASACGRSCGAGWAMASGRFAERTDLRAVRAGSAPAVNRVAQSLLAGIVLQMEVELVHDVGVAEPRLGIRERERAASTRRAERARARSEPDGGSGPQEAEREVARNSEHLVHG